ncbi:GNAT family N-acetyltransferase [Sphingomonas sp. LY160]|uniref:GNAT family N-acetyltransferase n=1 Tax=Sphingomonas sp. LY160 TaxID=3095342 RepID=UPI002ADEB6E3|nr:GNAT family N-acetyltransferase [Sphingomonas sp. LY160]MEA1072324.1 GNAT family N-acetyltransferase [Sphingomonas sp. LY160]
MADREAALTARIASGFGAIDASEWDTLAGTGDPFLRHAFFDLLETSGSVGAEQGWSPLPILIDRDDRAVAAVPGWLKTHSQGEYVFDHGWADAWERAGGAYYPKLQVAVPFTPCPGRRLLGSSPDAALSAIEAVTVQNQLSSAHITFLADDEADRAQTRGWLRRDGLQFHWHNRGYADFDDFLAVLSSRKRKVIRKERAAAVEGLEVRTLRGAEIDREAVAAMWRFYQDTGSRKWGRPYLTRAFFDGMVAAMGDALLLFMAYRDGRPVAGALNFVGADALYGRYWGAEEEVPFLHFELSYYRAIDWAIANRLPAVQAGAQGEHKLARGYEPVITPSVHYIPDHGFRRAIADFLVREREAVAQEREWAMAALPYRSTPSA